MRSIRIEDEDGAVKTHQGIFSGLPQTEQCDLEDQHDTQRTLKDENFTRGAAEMVEGSIQ